MLLFTACSKEIAPPSPASSSMPAATERSSDLVITPAGLMPRSNVHHLPSAHYLSFENGRIQQFEKLTDRLVADFGDVKVVPSRAPEAQGWIAYAYWTNKGKAITGFTTDWTVPSTPSDQGGQTIFLFNGMQDGTTTSSYIIQPVLQWGPSAAGGGNYWAATSWFVTSTQAFFGDLVAVSPGQNLQGALKETAVSAHRYSYSSSFEGLSANVSLTVRKVPEAFWAAETLESYGVTDPSTMYPPNTDIAMRDIQIWKGSKNASIDWLTAQAVSGSAQKAVVVSDASPGGVVDIYFR
jgi:hypothetical protein